MGEERVQRRLAAIVAADVVGYSRMMARDEAGTLARLKRLRADFLHPKAVEYGGRVVKTTGDGTLIEFGSAVDAVAHAIDVQRGLIERNQGVPEDEQIRLRVGINVGDIIIDADDIFGDGVNVAARLEALAEPDGILLSARVHDYVRGRLDVPFEDLGMRSLKNIDEPVHVFRVCLESGARAAPGGRTAAMPRPDKPSIAVLPFQNMSADAEQEFFADGITEDIITELSRFPDLIVIARNSTFTYKDRAVRVQDVGRELGVSHVVEGSVRKAGQRVRITVQLIDAETGSHIWAERYDRDLVDIFELQDEITQSIVGVLPGRVAVATAARLKRKPPHDMAAYELILAGKILHHRVTPDANLEALRLLDRAIALEPDFAAAWAWRACTLGQSLGLGSSRDPRETFRLAVEAVHKALALDENNVDCHRVLCEINMEERRWDLAQLHHDKAFSLNPNDSLIVAQRGELLTWLGRADEGAGWVEKAMRLDPFEAHRRAHLLGRALHAARRYAAAIEAFKQVRSPRYAFVADMAACHARLGEADAAAARVADVLRLKPDFSSQAYATGLPYCEPDDRAHHLEGLRMAGLPA
jgi:adenylate cyclase